MLSQIECPGCGGTEHTATTVKGVLVCKGCNAIHGECTEAESLFFFTPEWHEGDFDREIEGDDCRYIDLDIDGVRFHGWIHPKSKKVVQVG